ncbi:MAG: hypothetical protein JW993_04295 [Sedimentisphaerales bacterium]|nr:hypothetical protein [Sedimentisphaerales bacterium]
MKKLLLVILLAGLGCSPHGYRRDGGGYTLYRSRMMMPESASSRARLAPPPTGRPLDRDDPLPDESPNLFDSYLTLRP